MTRFGDRVLGGRAPYGGASTSQHVHHGDRRTHTQTHNSLVLAGAAACITSGLAGHPKAYPQPSGAADSGFLLYGGSICISYLTFFTLINIMAEGSMPTSRA